MSARQAILECLRRTAELAARFLAMLGPIDAEIDITPSFDALKQREGAYRGPSREFGAELISTDASYDFPFEGAGDAAAYGHGGGCGTLLVVNITLAVGASRFASVAFTCVQGETCAQGVGNTDIGRYATGSANADGATEVI